MLSRTAPRKLKDEDDKEEFAGRLQNALERSEVSYTKKELQGFLENISLSRQNPGTPAAQTLRFLRRSRGLTQGQFTSMLNLPKGRIKNWELGIRPINPYQLQNISEQLSLSDQEKDIFGALIKEANIGVNPPKSSTTPVTFNAFDKEWLSKQPREQQLRLLLVAKMIYINPSSTWWGNKIGIVRSKVSGWLSGEEDIPSEMASRIKRVIASSEDVDFPISDKAGFDSYYTTLLLERYRERKNLSQHEVATRLNIDPSTISWWELGEYKIDSHKLGSLVKALSLSADEAQELILLINPNIINGIESGSIKHWLEKTIKEENWEYINLGLS